MLSKVKGTPVMRQFWRTKKENPDSVLLFRMGDFYETFEEDAKIASKVLGITLTKRSNGAAADVPLAGFPYHALDQYLHKLLESGYKVAICEQIEDPKDAKGIVKREVVEVVTPGTSLSDNFLNQNENNYLASLVIEKNLASISLLDFSTGEFFGLSVNIKDLENIIYQYNIKEIIIPESTLRNVKKLKINKSILITGVPNWYLDSNIASDYLKAHFKIHNFKGFGISNDSSLIKSAAFGLDYVNQNYKGKTSHIISYKKIEDSEYLALDSYTLNNLEVFSPINHENKNATLINTIDQTSTAIGSRMLRKWIRKPLTNIDKINSRLNSIQEFIEYSSNRDKVIDLMKYCSDIDRILSRISANKTNPRDILSLANSLMLIDSIKKIAAKSKLKNINSLLSKSYNLNTLLKMILNIIVEDAPANYLKGGFVRDGFNKELDEYRKISKNATKWLLEYQKKIQEETKIKKIKIGYNRVFGYYIEVSKVNIDKVPENFIRKQTLTNAERYFTEELKEYENKILNSQENVIRIEIEILDKLKDDIIKFNDKILENSRILAKIDIASSLSLFAERNNYIKPKFSNRREIKIKNSRHPVIEQLFSIEDDFIPNDFDVNNKNRQISIITGPNMAGKSTFLRQLGLIVILAQSGIYVPCTKAKLPIIDKLFTRVGASDNLASGESTFLVEMNETANILNNLTSKSLILLDEIGRGTSTYDGLALAWSITEFIHESKFAPITLFATHYHELINLADKLKKASNHSVSIQEEDDKIVFLRKIIPGGIDKSYGIHVAKMAGIPSKVLLRSYEILEGLLKANKSQTKIADIKFNSFANNLNEEKNKKIKTKLESIDINNITPVEAIIILGELVNENKN